MKCIKCEIFNSDKKIITIPLRIIIENIDIRSGWLLVPTTKTPNKAEIWLADGAVGPLTLNLHPPNRAPKIPPQIAPMIPDIGPSCDICPKARASGSAIIPRVIPVKISLVKLLPILEKLDIGLIFFKLFFILIFLFVRFITDL